MNIEKEFIEIRDIIKKAKEKAFYVVNIELINLYWDIGKYISEKINSSEWGNSFVINLAEHLKRTEPDIKGFSSQNLWRMKESFIFV